MNKSITKKKKNKPLQESVSPSKKGRTISISGAAKLKVVGKPAKIHITKKASSDEIRKALKIKVSDKVFVSDVIKVVTSKKASKKN